MSTTNNQTVRMLKLSLAPQAKAAVRDLQPIWSTGGLGLMRSWEDLVAAVSLAVFVATILFLFVVG